MSLFAKAHYDKVLLALAVIGVAASCGWMAQRQSEIRRLRVRPVAVELANAAYVPVAERVSETKTIAWSTPAPQSQGWLYDIFTPPLIAYDAKTNAFTVTPPMGGAVERSVPFDLELVEVQQEPFRLQLVGYYGEAGDYAAAFTSPGLPDTLLARAGHRFEKLGLTLRKISVTKVEIKHADPWPAFEVAAFAELLDDASGTEIVLDSRTPRLTDKLQAVLRSRSGGGVTCTRREGETFVDGQSTYRIDRIQRGPPEVVVTRLALDPLPAETRKLCPIPKKDGALTSVASSQTHQPELSSPETAHH